SVHICYIYVRFKLHSVAIHTYLLSFPTRRSSDLDTTVKDGLDFCENRFFVRGEGNFLYNYNNGRLAVDPKTACQNFINAFDSIRSEEHTSELQSRFDLVCRLLLEKKKYDITLSIS